jgi:flagellar biosynthesis anti-sigma factor FlgM
VNITNMSNDLSQAQISSSNVSNPAAAAAAAAARGTTAPSAPVSEASQGGDQATISSASGVLSSALNSSDVRTPKVAALQASINAGTYNIPAGSVADKMLSSILGS